MADANGGYYIAVGGDIVVEGIVDLNIDRYYYKILVAETAAVAACGCNDCYGSDFAGSGLDAGGVVGTRCEAVGGDYGSFLLWVGDGGTILTWCE